MLDDIKNDVFQANLQLVKYGLIVLTWGNASAIDRKNAMVVIKPSGISYETMTAEDMVVVDLNGLIVSGKYRPSSDLQTHLELYKQFPKIGGVIHTHSRAATAFAQAESAIPCYGTTHADHFYGEIPCTRSLTQSEIENDYELNTGKVIVKTFIQRNIDPIATPGVLVSKHGPFAWGSSIAKAVENALVLEEIAYMALITRNINPAVCKASNDLMDKHYFRKHGETAYYGQL